MGEESGTRCDRALKGSILRFVAVVVAVLAASVLAMVLSGKAGLSVALLIWTVPVVAAFTVFSLANTRLFRRPDGRRVCRFEAANSLTAIRIFLVPPVLVLLEQGYLIQGAVLWLVAELTDVADGFVARRFAQETEFGVMVDPVGDIMATIAVFTWLFLSGRVPSWLYALLVARYVQFFAGLAILALMGRLPRLRATAAGKVAGVVQGTIIMFLLLRAALGDTASLSSRDDILFPVLGAAFLSVIVSQTAIGLKAVRNHDSG